MGLISSIASVFGYDPMKKAAKKAAKEAKAGQDESLGYFAPYSDAAGSSIKPFLNALGLGDSEAAIAAFQNSPLFKLQYDAALKAGQQGVADLGTSGGIRRSGATLRALADNAREITNRTYSDYVNPLGRLYETGVGIQGNKANIRMGGANAIGDAKLAVGAAKAGTLAGFDNLLSDAAKAYGYMSGG